MTEKKKKYQYLLGLFVSSLFRSRFKIYSAESATLPRFLQGNFTQKQSGRKLFKTKEILLYELKLGSEKARCGNTCSFIKIWLAYRLNTWILMVSEVRPYHCNTFTVYQVVLSMWDAPGSKYLFIYFLTATFLSHCTEEEHGFLEWIQ